MVFQGGSSVLAQKVDVLRMQSALNAILDSSFDGMVFCCRQALLVLRRSRSSSIFGGLIAKNASIYMAFAISRKRGKHETL